MNGTFMTNNQTKNKVELPKIGSSDQYNHLMKIIQNRVTVRKFDENYIVPDKHFEMIIEAARHAPSGANSQPWHFIVVKKPEIKKEISEYFVKEQRIRAKLKMKFPTPNYKGLAGAPGFIVICSDMRWTKAFPVLKNDNSELNKMYKENAERILLQSLAASTMSAHLAAASLGSETSGSILSPSSANSLVGMKPTIGNVSRAGIVPISSTLDTAGPMTKFVIDNILIYNAINDFDPLDDYSVENYDIRINEVVENKLEEYTIGYYKK